MTGKDTRPRPGQPLQSKPMSKVEQFDLNLKRRFDPPSCTLDDFRSCDGPMRRCLEMAWIAARTELPVLLLGESGTGKTLLARAIHNSSQRAEKPFVAFNAAALSESLLDSQLFGHEKGAFTDAGRRVRGKVELADGGTLFLDEIADMSASAQAKILRAVEYGEFERLGSEELQCCDVRLISATHLDPRRLAEQGTLRSDLFHRINGITLELPPLRDRPYDLPFLVAAEIEWAASRHGKEIRGLSREAALRLFSYDWPGNLRELNRVLRAAVAICEGPLLPSSALLIHDVETGSEGGSAGPAGDGVLPEDLRLATLERRHVLAVFRHLGGNKSRTARALGISRSTLDRKLSSYGV